MNYEITYSVGTTIHDERRYVAKCSAERLATKIRNLQNAGKVIYEVVQAH